MVKDQNNNVLKYPDLAEAEKTALKRDIVLSLAGGVSQWKYTNLEATTLPDYNKDNGANAVYQCDNVGKEESGNFIDWKQAYEKISTLTDNDCTAREDLYLQACDVIWPMLTRHWNLVESIATKLLSTPNHTLNEETLYSIWNSYQKRLKFSNFNRKKKR